MKSTLAFSLFVLVFTSCASAPTVSEAENVVTIQYAESKEIAAEIEVEVARTQTEQEQGLQNHAPLDAKHGMLFIFPYTAEHTFWNKDVSFPIDIIYTNDTGTIVNIYKSVPSCMQSANCPLYNDYTASRYVLEVQGGLSDTLKVQVGDKLVSPLIPVPNQ